MAGDNNLLSNWSATDIGSVVYLQTQLTAPAPFQELNDRPMDGTVYHAMLHVCSVLVIKKTSDVGQRPGISWQIEEAGAMRAAIVNGQPLSNTVDRNFHSVGGFVFLSIDDISCAYMKQTL